MLKIKCYACQKELVEKGAILLSPPDEQTPEEDLSSHVTGRWVDHIQKIHLCGDCYEALLCILNELCGYKKTWVKKDGKIKLLGD
jgi:hypothetical protein